MEDGVPAQQKLNLISADAVRSAVAEYDEIGRKAFLQKYGFGKAAKFYLALNGKVYDAKAILGVAYKFVAPDHQPLRFDDFASAERTVRRPLEKLGFTVELKQLIESHYERGRVYNRRADIHDQFGGQERGGIATPDNCTFVFLFTGQQGTEFGYEDKLRPDGVFEYTGEGQAGDMQFVRGNRAIRDHAQDGKELPLFEAQKKKGDYRFLGSYVCDDWEYRPTPDKDGKERKAIVFHLVPLESVGAGKIDEEDVGPPQSASLTELRKRAYVSASLAADKTGTAKRSVYVRSRDVRDYVLKRADGTCESCQLPAPFKRKDGTPYLEPHHTRRISDGGPDHPRWVGGICPTCHRRIHHGTDGGSLNEALQKRLGEIEGSLV